MTPEEARDIQTAARAAHAARERLLWADADDADAIIEAAQTYLETTTTTTDAVAAATSPAVDQAGGGLLP